MKKISEQLIIICLLLLGGATCYAKDSDSTKTLKADTSGVTRQQTPEQSQSQKNTNDKASADINVEAVLTLSAIALSIVSLALSCVFNSKAKKYRNRTENGLETQYDRITRLDNAFRELEKDFESVSEDCKDLCSVEIESFKQEFKEIVKKLIETQKKPEPVKPQPQEEQNLEPEPVFTPYVRYSRYKRQADCFKEAAFAQSPDSQVFKITITGEATGRYEVLDTVRPEDATDVQAAVDCQGYDDWKNFSKIENVTPGTLVKDDDENWKIDKKLIVKLV